MSLPPTTQGACPICGKPNTEKYRPFCSRHCADIDLGRWFTEQYRAPVPDNEEPDESPDHPA